MPDVAGYIYRLVEPTCQLPEDKDLCRKLARLLVQKYSGVIEPNGDGWDVLPHLLRVAVEKSFNSPRFGFFVQLWIGEVGLLEANDLELLFRLAKMSNEIGYEPLGNFIMAQSVEDRLKIRKEGPQVNLYGINGMSKDASLLAQGLVSKEGQFPPDRFSRAIELAAQAIGIESARIEIDRSKLPLASWTLTYLHVVTLLPVNPAALDD